MHARGLITILLAGTVATSVAAQQAGGRERMLSRECRREVVQLCGINRDAIRKCLARAARRPVRRMQGADGAGHRTANAPNHRPANAARPRRVRSLYGTDPLQQVDLYTPATARPSKGYPLAIYIHGGGWRNGTKDMVAQKPGFFNAQGWAFASVGYRLLPDAPVEQQAADVAAAIAKLTRDSATLGIDPDRIIVMGHSAGAHLAALVATDPAYLGADIARLWGVVLIDGAGYDVARQMEQGSLADPPHLRARVRHRSSTPGPAVADAACRRAECAALADTACRKARGCRRAIGCTGPCAATGRRKGAARSYRRCHAHDDQPRSWR